MRVLLWGLLALVLAGCDETPTGRSQLALVPDALMAKLGADSFDEMRERRPIVEDAALERRVRCVADAVVDAARRHYPRADVPEAWEVVVFDDPTPNAFALPGGRIGVHRGLLRVAETPAQLSAVIGHEVAHVLADHGNERLTQRLGIKAALLVVGLFSEGELAGEPLRQALGVGARLGISLPFSRTHEEEADLMGLEIMAAAGFAPEASVALWRNMAAAGGGQPPQFLSTHPAHESRIEALQRHLAGARRLGPEAAPPACGLGGKGDKRAPGA
ncbi:MULTISPECIES: M48 family metallopeptidase [Halomonas]|uniref:Zn-dependent protease n=1 Tax=Halomonas halophila TaxID=29573 RepID=A0ABQ0U7Q8_9GAMM|nr:MULTISPECIES: M48 family metallopeptidase [Halomonas]MDR5888464.1 M48 family metallopeptidase [Halomonas salina]WJY07648.1 M48 family metallopeptidase [Halomonas halophila]GEK73069.1 Zn-dependent protease [Halomonas halophila]